MKLCSVWTATALLGTLVLSGCEEPKPLEVPEELIGYWTTDAPKYADRFFELRADRTAVFGLGGSNKDISAIVGIETVREGSVLIYHISHLSASGEVYVFSVSYHLERPGYLRFVNQPYIVWRKRSESASLTR